MANLVRSDSLDIHLIGERIIRPGSGPFKILAVKKDLNLFDALAWTVHFPVGRDAHGILNGHVPIGFEPPDEDVLVGVE